MTAHFLDAETITFSVTPRLATFAPVELSPEQSAAFAKVMAWWHDPNRQQIFSLLGVAGSGKSTLAERSAASGVVYCSFTGKAAHCLRQKGCPAVTIHSLIKKPLGSVYDAENGDYADIAREFRDRCEPIDCHGEPGKWVVRLWHGFNSIFPEQKESDRIETISFAVGLAYGTVEKILLASIDPEFAAKALKRAPKLIIVDEMSVINDDLGQNLVDLGYPILAIGDPNQLPPIVPQSDEPKESFFATPTPDVMLTGIQRQAAGSPVLALAADAREGRALAPGHYGKSQVLHWRTLIEDRELLVSADIVICGTNKTRRKLNEEIRKALGRKNNMPARGDKIICLPKLGLLPLDRQRVRRARRKGAPDRCSTRFGGRRGRSEQGEKVNYQCCKF